MAKRGRKAQVLPTIILTLREVKQASAADLGCSSGYLINLAKAENPVVKVAAKVQTGKRGRPANVFSLTKRGQGVALNMQRKVQSVQTETVAEQVAV